LAKRDHTIEEAARFESGPIDSLLLTARLRYVSGEEWAFVAPYLALVREDAPQRTHNLRTVFNGLRWIVRTGSSWRYMPNDLPPWEAVYQLIPFRPL
jgi:transposase